MHPGPDRGDQRLDLVVLQDLVDPALLDVDDLAAQRQHRLRVAVAGLLRRAACRIALHDEQLRVAGSLTEQSASLPGRVEFSSADLRRVRSRALRAASRARAASTAFWRIRRPSPGFSSRNSPELAVDRLLDQALDRRVPELGLRLALELRIAQLHRDHRGEPLADVLAAQVLVLLLQQALLARVGVQGAGQRRAEARQVRAPLVGVDVVGEAEHRLLVGGVPLHRDLDLAVVGLVLEVDGLAVQRVLVLVQVGDEVDDPALVLEGLAAGRRRARRRRSIRRLRVRKAVSRSRSESVW